MMRRHWQQHQLKQNTQKYGLVLYEIQLLCIISVLFFMFAIYSRS